MLQAIWKCYPALSQAPFEVLTFCFFKSLMWNLVDAEGSYTDGNFFENMKISDIMLTAAEAVLPFNDDFLVRHWCFFMTPVKFSS